jgi:predicted membrane channel-forming protein YqfA (hemolysin III family)
MEAATTLVIFVLSLFVCITVYAVYTSFGPDAKKLRDPFEEHEE